MNNKNLLKLFREAAYGHSMYDVFGDFCAMSAIALSNAVDLAQREEREKRYMEIVKRYDEKTMALFPKMFIEVVEEMEKGPSDVLGATYMELEIGNKNTGQFFTPYSLCRMIAQMQIDDSLKERINERGFITVNEPAVGGGAMVIAFAEALRAAGLNPQTQIHVTAQDVDSRSVHMTYIQLTLLHIPAVVLLGNTLTIEVRSAWYTPAHILGGWNWKLRAAPEPVSNRIEEISPIYITPVAPLNQPELFR